MSSGNSAMSRGLSSKVQMLQTRPLRNGWRSPTGPRTSVWALGSGSVRRGGFVDQPLAMIHQRRVAEKRQVLRNPCLITFI